MLKIQSGNKHELLKQNGKSLLFLVSLSEAHPAWFLKGSCPRKAICNIVIKTAEPLRTTKSLQAERPPTAPLPAGYPHSRPARGWNLRTSRPQPGRERREGKQPFPRRAGDGVFTNTQERPTCSAQGKAHRLSLGRVCSERCLLKPRRFGKVGVLPLTAGDSGTDDLKTFPVKRKPK